MARARRRSSKKTPEPAGASENDEAVTTAQPEEAQQQQQQQQEERCPACNDGGARRAPDVDAAGKEKWVCCDACKTWFHWRCAGDAGDLAVIDKWFCKACITANPARVITLRPPTRKSARKRTTRDYGGLHAGQEADPTRWLRMMEGKPIRKDPFRRMRGGELGLEWLETDEDAMRAPVVVLSDEGLGMKMPASDFDVEDVVEAIGEDYPVEVIDVASQSTAPGWTLGKWLEYWNTEPEKRDKIRNIISLEISGTDLADKVLPPRLVRELDWVEKFWPNTKKGRGHTYPKVQLYCLMGVSGAWTDWHIDFAGSSVYYHILHGSKVFYFIRPTPANLAAYERWSGTEMQSHSWLGDLCDEVFKVELTTGNTMIIPTGWIHAVYTPIDTLVFGGNFLHSYNVATQLRVREIEIATHVPKKFRFPYFEKLCWYAGEKFLRDIKGKEEFPPRVLEGVEALSEFLVSEARMMEKGTDVAKRQAKEHVPSDRVKDAPALARELRWRARQAAGATSDDEGHSSKKAGKAVANGETSANGANKRKRVATEGSQDAGDLFRNFKRAVWEKVVERPAEMETRVARARRPADEKGDGWAEPWVNEADQEGVGDGGEEARVERRRNVIVKVRRTAKGLERQRIERVVEEWVWPDGHGATAQEGAPVAGPDGDIKMGDGGAIEGVV